MRIAQDLGNHQEIAISHNYLGYVSCALADYPAACQHLLAALQIAIDDQITPIVLNTLVGWATVNVQKSTAENAQEPAKALIQALELLALVLHYPATSHETKAKAQRLWARLEADLPPQLLATAQAGSASVYTRSCGGKNSGGKSINFLEQATFNTACYFTPHLPSRNG